jgi:hypothetical protein
VDRRNCDASSSVTSVNLSNKAIGGTAPSSLLSLAGMETVNFGGNKDFSAWLLTSSPAPSLKYIHVDDTNLNGVVPATEWCALTGLYYFRVSSNDLTGAFPVCLLEKTGMENMNAYNNDFTAWSLTSSPASSQKVVSVANTNLEGTVPPVAWCVLADDLTSLSLGNEALSTAIPYCAPCPRRNYREEGTTECTPCPTGMFTFEPGAISLDSCRLAHACTFVATAGVALSYCSPGTYGCTLGGTAEANACLDCPAGTFSRRDGAIELTLTKWRHPLSLFVC